MFRIRVSVLGRSFHISTFPTYTMADDIASDLIDSHPAVVAVAVERRVGADRWVDCYVVERREEVSSSVPVANVVPFHQSGELS